MANAMFDELKSLAGWTDRDCQDVTITGRDPVLPTRFLVGEISAGVHAACGLAAARLWQMKTGRRQRVTVDVRAAAATMRSFFYLQLAAGMDQMTQASMLGGFYQTRDNKWFFVHPGFPHLREGVLKLLGCEDNAESCAAAVRQHNADELEDSFAEYGLCGAKVRTAAEWAGHPQGQMLARLPAVQIIRIGDSPPEPLPKGDRPLSGIRCCDLTRVLAGPTTSRTLAEHGADVLKISAKDLPTSATFDVDTGHGKRAAFLDIRRPDDTEKLWELTAQADVFCQSYRLGALAGHGFSPEEVARKRPGIVYMFMNCYGPVGPWARRRGWEQLAQTVSGLSSEEGDLALPQPNADALKAMGRYGQRAQMPSGKPRLLPGAITDYTTGYLLAFGAMVALWRRAVEGGSYMVASSLTQAGMAVERMGRADAKEAQAQVETLLPAEVEKLTVESDTAYGRIKYLAPVVQMSETPARWDLPTVPLGTHQPVWLERPR
jgi:crotonobetainyl-CoA:carnitine CoA-transferase CaiB-like acyl-CoA transferase